MMLDPHQETLRKALTKHMLESIFAPAGNWQQFSGEAYARLKNNLPLISHEILWEIQKESLYPELIQSFTRKYLIDAQPLQNHDAYTAYMLLSQDFWGWSRKAILAQPEGPKHLGVLGALKTMMTKDQLESLGQD